MEEFSAFYSFDYSALAGEDALFQLTEVEPFLPFLFGDLKVDEDRVGVVDLDFHDTSTHRIAGHNLTLDIDYGITNLKLITTYREWDNTEEGTELDGNAILGGVQLFAAMNERHHNQFSQEAQFYGDVGERVDYVTGFYYFRESFDELNPQILWAVPFPITLEYEGEAEAWAGYTDWTWTPPVLDDRFKLSAGARYSHDEKEFDQQSPVSASGDDTWRQVDWQGTASYQWTDALMSYARVATGYKSGGFNPRSGTSEPFDEETVLTYELGAKTQFLDDRLQLNGAVFYSDYDDLQVDQFIAGALGAASQTVNAGKATIWGIEFEALAQITDHISTYVNYGWLDMQYDEFEIRDPGAGDAIVDVASEAVFGYRPQQTLSAGLGYTSDPIGDCEVVLSARLDALYVDDVWFHPIDVAPSGFPITPFNDSIKESGYTLFHSSVTLSEIEVGPRSKMKFTLWGRNLLDEKYRRSGIDFGQLGFAGNVYGEPRTYGLTATFEY
jgi:iron complex outermembrane receptor protein